MSSNECDSLRETKSCQPWSSTSIVFGRDLRSVQDFDRLVLSTSNSIWNMLQCNNFAGNATVRYTNSFFCHSRIAELGTNCRSSSRTSTPIPSFCQSSCLAFVSSVESALKDPSRCSASVNEETTKRRNDALASWKSSCRSVTISSDPNTCIVGVRSEQYQCGFISLDQAAVYCKADSTKGDNCCNSPDIQNNLKNSSSSISAASSTSPSTTSRSIMPTVTATSSPSPSSSTLSPSSSSSKPTPSLNSASDALSSSSTDWCSSLAVPCSAFIASIVGVVLLIILTAIVFVTMKRHQRKARVLAGVGSDEDFDDRDLNVAAITEEKSSMSNASTSDSYDNDNIIDKYTPNLPYSTTRSPAMTGSSMGTGGQPLVVSASKLTKNAPSPLTFLLDDDEEEEEEGSTSSAPRMKGLAPSARGWLKEGYTIYECTRSLVGEGPNQLRLRNGDQLIVKEMYSDGLALGLNLFTGEEGVLPLHAIAPASLNKKSTRAPTTDKKESEYSKRSQPNQYNEWNHKRAHAVNSSSLIDKDDVLPLPTDDTFDVYDDSIIGDSMASKSQEYSTLNRKSYGRSTELSSVETFPYDEPDAALAYDTSNPFKQHQSTLKH